MSAAVGIFTRAFGVGDGLNERALMPLPVREEGANNVGKGRAAGHRVQLADWAFLIEAAEQRATWANLSTMYTVRHDMYPHNYVQRLYDDADAETYNTETLTQSPVVAAWQRVNSLNISRFFKPDTTPTSSDGWWNFAYEGNDRANYLYNFVTPYGSTPTGHLRRVDDVRALFYDIKNCTRAGNYTGTFTPYDGGTQVSNNAPRVDVNGGSVSARYEADELRNTRADIATFFSLHHEVAADADFDITPAYAIIQLRMYQSRDSTIIRNYGRYIRTSWTLDKATATASIDLAACGCDADGVEAWMATAAESYVSGDVYIGTARLAELVYDLTLPVDGGLYYGWTWTP